MEVDLPPHHHHHLPSLSLWPVDPQEDFRLQFKKKKKKTVWLPFPSYLDCKVFSSCLCFLTTPESEEIHSLSCDVFCYVKPHGLQYRRCNDKPFFFFLHPQSGLFYSYFLFLFFNLHYNQTSADKQSIKASFLQGESVVLKVFLFIIIIFFLNFSHTHCHCCMPPPVNLQP